MKRLLAAAVEAGLLLTFATGATAALFDPAAAPLAWQGSAVVALLALVGARAYLHRGAAAVRGEDRGQ